MKQLIVSFSFFLFLSLNLSAQQNHFIYIQADNKQPFYVKLNDKIYSSSSSGYIILSKLIEADYNLTIGFPKNEWPEQKLNLTVQKNDLGYLLKNFEEKGWGLVDMNSFQIVYNNALNNTKPSNIAVKNNVVKEDLKPSETKPLEKNIVKVEAIKEKPVEVKKEDASPAIVKLFTSKSNNNIEMVYLVKNNATFDTVKIVLATDEYKTQISQETKPLEKPVQQATIASSKEATNSNAVSKNNCKSIANEEDYKKLRKKMAAAESDNEMLFKAATTFQKQCYTTEQIKTLSFLFLNDEGKYKFFDAAYTHISDAENFSKLVSLLSDEYYIKRFNTMLKN